MPFQFKHTRYKSIRIELIHMWIVFYHFYLWKARPNGTVIFYSPERLWKYTISINDWLDCSQNQYFLDFSFVWAERRCLWFLVLFSPIQYCIIIHFSVEMKFLVIFSNDMNMAFCDFDLHWEIFPKISNSTGLIFIERKSIESRFLCFFSVFRFFRLYFFFVEWFSSISIDDAYNTWELDKIQWKIFYKNLCAIFVVIYFVTQIFSFFFHCILSSTVCCPIEFLLLFHSM